MDYEIGDLPLQALLPAIARAEDQLARLDEAVRRNPVGQGYIERGHFFDAAASMWVAGELVHVEDLVLHDAHMDIRTPTHELTIAHAILRSRRRIAAADAAWSIGEAGMAALTGATSAMVEAVSHAVVERGGEEAEELGETESNPLAVEFAHIDAVLERSQRLMEKFVTGSTVAVPERPVLAVGDLVIRDPEWGETERLSLWRNVLKAVEAFPPGLAAALLFDAWESLEPMQRQHWLGGQLVSAYLRSRGKVVSHLPAFNVGLKSIARERRRAQARTIRLLAFLEAMSATADAGMKEISRLSQARELMERRLRGRRSSSNLPVTVSLVLSRPIISAAMVAKAAGVTPRGALNLIGELGLREMTGRGRYRAWGIL